LRNWRRKLSQKNSKKNRKFQRWFDIAVWMKLAYEAMSRRRKTIWFNCRSTDFLRLNTFWNPRRFLSIYQTSASKRRFTLKVKSLLTPLHIKHKTRLHNLSSFRTPISREVIEKPARFHTHFPFKKCADTS
jgi:hypothetical protein